MEGARVASWKPGLLFLIVGYLDVFRFGARAGAPHFPVNSLFEVGQADGILFKYL